MFKLLINVQGSKMKKTLFCLLVFSIFLITSQISQVSASEEYVVEKNDTLWDISTRKLEDPFLWPKLWNVNPHIKNPDLIYPGTKVFIPSREELMQLPALPAKEIPVARKETIQKQSQPKSVWKYAPLMQRKHIIEKNLFIASGWISDIYPAIGEITASSTNQQLTSKNDIIYIEVSESHSPEKPALILSGNKDSMANKRFFAIRDIKIVKHPVSGKKIGHQIRIAGILEVIGMDGNMTKARIIDSFEDVHIGDGLLPYQELEPPLIPDTVRTPDIQGYIIESHMNSQLVSEGNVIFLDKGENDDIKIGDVFTVLREQPAESPIGKIQIVSLQPSTSGAIILQNSQEIKIGTKWGQQ
jgi:hypothetical protein